jgi:CubicO group peptidase (beta-lactamase class C family)
MKAVRNLMQNGVENGVFPGGVLLVADKGQVVFLEAFGRARLMPERPMTTDTVFDLASLTKPLATTVSLMILVQQAMLRLDQTLASAIPDFSDTDKQGITVSQLLSHTSGVPDYRPYYETLVNVPSSERKSALKNLLLNESLVHEPGKDCLYSDPGFLILAWLVEVVTQKPLDRFVEDAVYTPLKLKTLFFVPLNVPKGDRGHAYAATQYSAWRGKIVDGEVHDENAYALGGVAGHAGLFGTAHDVYILLRELLNAYLCEPNTGLFHQDVVKAFFKRHSDVGSWALGFDTPTRPDSSSGHFFSDQSVGHLGFTGTSFWMDLEKGAVVILLTNRIHPTGQNQRIKDFRPVLHDRVMEAISR